ncbi:protein eva-1 homolog C isoform X1 [Poeciliopsis prolifica]|uniref:protein eva-1 homolog C isoform X1 n=1 Tax=Poeciliopsis prolifica TaxID=188132 RepID=UPI0024137AB1|nr:protein eva-1 homolog C isoform X1 [Poeciliopsis prolifica]XP_054907220.1 protein eva-1 homolog C isoform X1 [Poeciliopsis prolifica]
MRVMSWTRPFHGLDWSHSLFYLTLLLWTRRMNGLADFSNYLSRIITSHSAHACDGTPLRLHCPRHSTISIQSAFYGSGEVRLCTEDPTSGPRSHRCSALTALQKLLSECQNLRDCQLPVSHLLFGKDPCPGKNKYLHVNYKCKPTEHKTQVVCEGETMILRCKTPNLLIIYAAVYGRGLGQADTCPSFSARPPPFECLNHNAVHVVSKSCYSKQKCILAVGNQTFRDPCFPGTRKYLNVLYSCVPMSLLKEADPNILSTTSLPTTEKAPAADLESNRPNSSGAMMSNSLLTYAFIKDHPEMAALLFTSSVCVGLLFTLLALSVRVTCRRRRQLRDHTLGAKSNGLTPSCSKQDDEEDEAEDDDDDNEETESSLLSTAERKGIKGWEEVTYVSEAAELAERIERRDMIIQEIWMNSYLNGSSC